MATATATIMATAAVPHKAFSIVHNAPAKLDNFESYITRNGKYPESIFLDEIPQLTNVLKRGMSLVGPNF